MRWKWISSTLALVACAHGAEPGPRAAEPEPVAAPLAPPSVAGDDAAVPTAAAPAPSSVPAVPSATAGEPAPAAAPPPAPSISPKKTARCQRDDQCAMEMDHDCCGECLGLPLTAISAVAERKAAAERSRHCAVMDVDCSGFHCPRLPPKCEAQARCRQGWCEVVVSKACEG